MQLRQKKYTGKIHAETLSKIISIIVMVQISYVTYWQFYFSYKCPIAIDLLNPQNIII